MSNQNEVAPLTQEIRQVRQPAQTGRAVMQALALQQQQQKLDPVENQLKTDMQDNPHE